MGSNTSCIKFLIFFCCSSVCPCTPCICSSSSVSSSSSSRICQSTFPFQLCNTYSINFNFEVRTFFYLGLKYNLRQSMTEIYCYRCILMSCLCFTNISCIKQIDLVCYLVSNCKVYNFFISINCISCRINRIKINSRFLWPILQISIRPIVTRFCNFYTIHISLITRICPNLKIVDGCRCSDYTTCSLTC